MKRKNIFEAMLPWVFNMMGKKKVVAEEEKKEEHEEDKPSYVFDGSFGGAETICDYDAPGLMEDDYLVKMICLEADGESKLTAEVDSANPYAELFALGEDENQQTSLGTVSLHFDQHEGRGGRVVPCLATD